VEWVTPEIGGFLVGHATDPEGLTGCSVVLCAEGAVAGVDVRGAAPGTRETDLLRPMNLVERVHAVLLSGGSAFGLDAAAGVVRFLEERGIGFDTKVARVPIVPAAVLFDLGLGSPKSRPDAAMGYRACEAARERPGEEGNVGAGTGASVGKVAGPGLAMKAGLGMACARLARGVKVAAIVAVNAFGDVLDYASGRILAGARKPLVGGFLNTLNAMTTELGQRALGFSSNTTIGVVYTNAVLDKEGANKVAQMAHDGLARSIAPVHTMFDGDTIFVMSRGKAQADLSTIGSVAALAVAEAVKRAVLKAEPAGGLPSASSLHGSDGG
jgi:L-aminopeptidase/D-esterase-like protein